MPRSKSLYDDAMEVSNYLKGGDILEFIDQCLEELDKNSIKEKEEEEKEKEKEQKKKALDFKTVAKLTCGMRRTNSEKVKNVKSGRVERSKSLKAKRPKSSNSSGARSRLGSGEDDDDDDNAVFNADRRSTLGDVDVSVFEEEESKPEEEKRDFKSLANRLAMKKPTGNWAIQAHNFIFFQFFDIYLLLLS